jgi:hypothetical protein
MILLQLIFTFETEALYEMWQKNIAAGSEPLRPQYIPQNRSSRLSARGSIQKTGNYKKGRFIISNWEGNYAWRRIVSTENNSRYKKGRRNFSIDDTRPYRASRRYPYSVDTSSYRERMHFLRPLKSNSRTFDDASKYYHPGKSTKDEASLCIVDKRDPQLKFGAEHWKVVDYPTRINPKGSRWCSSFRNGLDQTTRLVEIKWPENIHNPEGTFKLFKWLPTELRDMIWEFALPAPRVVSLRLRRYPLPPHYGIGYFFHFGLEGALTEGRIPGYQHLLSCKESASVFLAKYHKIQVHRSPFLRTIHWAPQWPSFVVGPKGYVDGNRDTLLITGTMIWDLAQFVLRPDLHRIKRLAIQRTIVPAASLYTFPSVEEIALEICPRLKTLSICMGSDGDITAPFGSSTIHTVDVDDDLLEAKPMCDTMFCCDCHSNIPTATTQDNIRRHFRNLIKIAEQRRDMMRQVVGFLRPERNIDCRFVIVSKRIDTEKKLVERVWLVPTRPERYGVVYYAQKPIGVQHTGIVSFENHPVRVADGSTLHKVHPVLGVYLDGSLQSQYDGIQEMFEQLDLGGTVKRYSVVTDFGGF